MSDKQQIRLGLVGYGEIGSTLGQGCARPGFSGSRAMTSTRSTGHTAR